MVRPGKHERDTCRLGGKRAIVGIVSVAMTASMVVPAFSTAIASADVIEAQSSALEIPNYSVKEQIEHVTKLLNNPTDKVIDEAGLFALLQKVKFTEQGLRNLSPECLAAFDEECQKEIKRLQKLLPTIEQPGSDDGAAHAPSQNVSAETAQSSASSASGADSQKPAAAEDNVVAQPPDEDEAKNADSEDAAKRASGSKKPSTAKSATASKAKSEKQAPDPTSLYPQWSYSGDRSMVTHKDVDLAQRAFIALYGERARAIAQEAGIYASVMLAQAILESDSGNAELAKDHKNLFRMKATDGAESVIMKTTQRTADGIAFSVDTAFAAYGSARDSMEDYADLLTHRSADLYRGALKETTADCFEACDWMQGRYSDASDYGEKLKAIIKTHGLEKYDEPLDYELVDDFIFPVVDGNEKQVVDEETGLPVTEKRGLLDLQDELTSHLGDTYVWGGATPGSFDCSGLVQYSYKKALGVLLPRTSYFQCLVGKDVDFADLHTGDLVFFTNKLGLCSHVGVYLGEGCYIEAPHAGSVVKVTTMEEKMPAFAKRVLSTRAVEKTPENEVAEGEATEEESLVPTLPALKDMSVSAESDSLVIPPPPSNLPPIR